jgi:hypothetical protein
VIRCVSGFDAAVLTTMRSVSARLGAYGSGGVCRLCPGSSDVNLFCYRKGIADLDAEVSDGAFDLCVAEQKLHGP